MRLTELNPEWRFPTEDGIPRILAFDCPCCKCGNRIELILKPQVPQGWDRTGDTFDTVTLRPSILYYGPGPTLERHWHGYITNGEVQHD